MSTESFSIKKIKLIVGLGNIGKDYERTRHNAGFLFLNYVAQTEFTQQNKFESFISKHNFDSSSVLLAKPTTLMNLSGKAVSKITQYFDIAPEELIVAHDDLDLALGNNKLQFGKGPKVHNGIIDIEKAMGTNQFWRYRIGVDARNPENRAYIAPHKYVLSRFSLEELEILTESFKSFYTNTGIDLERASSR